MKRPQRIAIVVGTRPEVIKCAPVVRALTKLGHRPDVIAFGQHVELLAQHLEEEKIRAKQLCEIKRDEHELRDGRLINSLISEAVRCGATLLDPDRHGLVLVQGDTTTAMAAALAAFHNGIPVGHIEAGLRTGDLARPFPEEANRRIIAQVARLHFAPTEIAKTNLIDEGHTFSSIHLVGNTGVDALRSAYARRPSAITRRIISTEKPYALVTCHRREGWRTYIPAVVKDLRQLDLPLVWPAHPNPEIQRALGVGSLHAIRGSGMPVGHVDFVHLLACAALVLTDSGGVTEEAAILGQRCIVLRGETERQEALQNGAFLVGPENLGKLGETVKIVLARKPPKASRAFGDGKASDRIAKICLKFLRS